jgi:arylsulfatase A-like enzyme
MSLFVRGARPPTVSRDRLLRSAVLACFTAAGFGALLPAPAAQSRPNVLLIVADDLGYGDLGSYGAADAKTPNLDRLAREGVRLTDFYANAPVCTPTRAALMTGRYHQRTPLDRPLSTTADHLATGLPVTGRTLPRLMRDAGYATALIGKWHLGFKPEFGPRAHGFDYFRGFLAGYVDWYTHVRGDGRPDLWENETPVTDKGYLHHATTRDAVRVLERQRAGTPFFLEVAYGAPHWPFQSPTEASVARRSNDSMFQDPSDPDAPTRARYVEILEDFDSQVGILLDTLSARGLAEGTLVVFISDNGGEWLSRNDPFVNRKDTVWEGGIRVPALLRWPARLPAGVVSGQVGITMDLTASFLALAGIARTDLRLEGIDIVSALVNGRPVDRTLFWRMIRPGASQRAMRSGDWKYVEDGGLRFLFDLRSDPGERHDLAGRETARVGAMRARVAEWEKDVDAEAGAAGKTPSPVPPVP